MQSNGKYFIGVLSRLLINQRRCISSLSEKDFIPKQTNPNKFGTLNPKTTAHIDALPEEDGDKTEIEYIDNKERKIKLQSHQYAAIIKQHLNSKNLVAALDVLENRMLQKEKAKPDQYIYKLLISGCGKYGYTKKAFQLFNQMKKRGIPVSGSTYTSLFNACANSPWPEDGLQRAKHLKELMLEKGWKINEITAHSMIKAFGRCGDINEAFRIVDEMVEHKLTVSIGTINFLLQACASDKKEGFRYALLVWRKLVQMKIKPDLYTFNLMLRCTRDCYVGDAEEILEDFQPYLPKESKELLRISSGNEVEFTESKISANPTTSDLKVLEGTGEEISVVPQNSSPTNDLILSQNQINFLSVKPTISAIVFIDKVKKPWHRLSLIGGAEGFIDTMVSCKVKPDIKTFTQLLETIPPSKQSEEELLKLMKEHNIKLDVDFCNLLIKKRNISVRFSEAKAVLDIIRREGLVPNLITFGVLALGCCNLKDAKRLINDITEHGKRLNAEILGTLVKRGCEIWDLRMIKYAMSVLLKEEIKPNNIMIKHLNNFKSLVEREKETFEERGKTNTFLAKEEFNKDWDNFLELMTQWNSLEIEDPENIHPWQQFRKTKNSPE